MKKYTYLQTDDICAEPRMKRLLPRWFRNTLLEADQRDLRRHLGRCRSCEVELQNLRNLRLAERTDRIKVVDLRRRKIGRFVRRTA